MFNRSLLGAIALLLVTTSLAQSPPLPDDPPAGGGSGTGGGTGGTGGTGGSGTSGSGATTWPYGSWSLHQFSPNGTMQYFNQYGLVSTTQWQSSSLTFQGYWPMNGRIRIQSNPQMVLRWNGPIELCPTKLYVRLTPRAEAQINFSASGNSMPLASVGRFDNNYDTTAILIKATGYGPLYKEATPTAAGLATIPAISIQVDASSSDFRGPILAKASYGLEFLPPVLISQLDDVRQNVVNNFRKGTDNTPVQNQYDRDGHLTIDVALMDATSAEKLWYKYVNLQSGYSFYRNPEVTLFIEDTDAQWEGPTLMYFKQLTTAEPGNSLAEVLVRDLDDADAPTLSNRVMINWHYPYDNWQEIGSGFDTNYPKMSNPSGDPGTIYEADSGETSTGRMLYSPLHTYEQEVINGKLETLIRAAITEWIPWKRFGPIIDILDVAIPEKLMQWSTLTNASFDAEWTDDHSVWLDTASGQYKEGRPDGANPGDYTMIAGKYLEYRCRAFHTDQYGIGGYTGTSIKQYAKLKDRPDSIGFFKYDPMY